MLRILFLLLLPVCQAFSQTKPTVAFIINEKDLIPEGIAYNPADGCFYLSSIHKHKIVRINAKGNVSDLITTDQHGVLQVLGMKVKDGNLWACNNSASHDSLNRTANVHVINTKDGSLVKKFTISDGRKHLFNDLVFTKTGDAYITDSDGASLFVIRNGADKMEEFLPSGPLVYANGIVASDDGNKVFVSTGTSMGIVSVHLTTKEIKPVQHKQFMLFGIDGLYSYKDSWIGIQNVFFPETILKMTPSPDKTSLTKLKTLVVDHPDFDTPTTGVIVGDDFYYIANSQLMQVVGNNGNLKSPETLKETLIMKIKLN